jgi:hypothetical protein
MDCTYQKTHPMNIFCECCDKENHLQQINKVNSFCGRKKSIESNFERPKKKHR